MICWEDKEDIDRAILWNSQGLLSESGKEKLLHSLIDWWEFPPLTERRLRDD